MQPYTLVVIDVQPGFKAAHVVADPIREEMQVAIQHGMGIVLVEYTGEGRTLVQDVAANYTRCWTVYKRYDSGAREVEHALSENKLPNNLRVCGVNTSACVSRTVFQLRVPKIEVVDDGCWCVSARSHREGLASMRGQSNVWIIPRLRCA
jgi:nicotinamidase-related amidase